MNPPDTFKVTWHRTYGFDTDSGETFFRWYWQANAWSWWLHHVCGYGCNTWKKDQPTALNNTRSAPAEHN